MQSMTTGVLVVPLPLAAVSSLKHLCVCVESSRDGTAASGNGSMDDVEVHEEWLQVSMWFKVATS